MLICKNNTNMEKIENQEVTIRDDIDIIKSLSNYEIYGKKRGWSGFAKGFFRYKSLGVFSTMYYVLVIVSVLLFGTILVSPFVSIITGETFSMVIFISFVLIVVSYLLYPLYAALSEIPPGGHSYYFVFSDEYVFKLDSSIGIDNRTLAPLLTNEFLVDKKFNRNDICNVDINNEKVNIETKERCMKIEPDEVSDIYDTLYNLE